MRYAQSGIALVGVLALLLAISTVSLAGLERAFWQTRLLSGEMAEQQALAAAEAAIRRVAVNPPAYAREPLAPAVAGNARDWRSLLQEYGQSLPVLSGYPAARVLVEYMADVSGYRITALGRDRAARHRVLLQAVLIPGDDARVWRRLR